LIRTLTDFPFSGFVTFTTEPIGIVFEAAVSAFGLNTSPLVVLIPFRPGPYHEALTRRPGGVGAALGWIVCDTGGSRSGGGAGGCAAHA